MPWSLYCPWMHSRKYLQYHGRRELIDAVIGTIEEGQAHDKLKISFSVTITNEFVEITDDDALQRIIEQGMDKWQIFLHPSQRKLVNAE